MIHIVRDIPYYMINIYFYKNNIFLNLKTVAKSVKPLIATVYSIYIIYENITDVREFDKWIKVKE